MEEDCRDTYWTGMRDATILQPADHLCPWAVEVIILRGGQCRLAEATVASIILQLRVSVQAACMDGREIMVEVEEGRERGEIDNGENFSLLM